MGLELPRHVHKPGGGRSDATKVVRDEAELVAAQAEGWVVDPNAPLEGPSAPTDVPGTELAVSDEPPAELPEPELEPAEAEPDEGAEDEPVRRKPGRPAGNKKK